MIWEHCLSERYVESVEPLRIEGDEQTYRVVGTSHPSVNLNVKFAGVVSGESSGSVTSDRMMITGDWG